MRNSAFAIIFLGPALANHPLHASSAHAQAIDETIVYVECTSPNDQAPRKGSGIIIDPSGYVLTAKHVVFGESSSLPDGTTCQGALGHAGLALHKLTYKDHSLRYDAAILKMPPSQNGAYTAAKYCKLTSDFARQLIFATGFPLETKTNVASSRLGVISTVETDEKGLIETDSATTEGMSGGMVTLGNSGNLVGMVAGVDTSELTGLPDNWAVLAVQELAPEFDKYGLTQTPCQVAQSPISSCRVCFKQGSPRKCLGEQQACSGWSAAKSGTAASAFGPAADEGWSDGITFRAGGDLASESDSCEVKWKIECE